MGASVLEAAAGRGEVEQRLRAVEVDARQLERQGMAYTQGQAQLLRAGVAAVRGRPEEALERYRRALSSLEAVGLGLYAAAARLRLGALLGGEQGRALVGEARMWMRVQGVEDPEAMAAVFAPVGR